MFRRFKYSFIRRQEKSKWGYFAFRRFYISKKFPGHKQWLKRVMRREYGIDKNSFKNLP